MEKLPDPRTQLFRCCPFFLQVEIVMKWNGEKGKGEHHQENPSIKQNILDGTRTSSRQSLF
jgi:hypothetical protein